MKQERVIKRILTFHPMVTLLILCLSALVFFFSSFNLFNLYQANFHFIAEHGIDALREGAARQLAEILLSTLVSAIAYIVIKACENILVRHLLR